VTVTVVVPTEKLPEAGEYVMAGDGYPIALAALGPLKLTVVAQDPVSALTVIFEGQVTVGARSTVSMLVADVD